MDDLDYIKDKIRIVDLCAYAGIPVQRNGFINCIFHQEKSPSLSIKDKDNFFKCFGCGKSGTVIDFYMQLYNKDLADAIKELKDLAGIGTDGTHENNQRKIPVQPRMSAGLDINKIKECMSNDELYIFDERLGMSLESDKEETETSKAAFRAVQQFRLEKNKTIFFELWTYCLKNFNSDKSFLSYLMDERKLSAQIIEKSDLFFIGNYNQVNNHLKKLFSIGDLQRSGLYNENGNLIFFRHNIIIPYKWKGEIVYLRGRISPGDTSTKLSVQGPKYLGLKNDELNLNTPKRFYNVDIVERLFPGEHLYITEGEFDALVMEDLGYNAVAIPGVGNTPNEYWLKRLFPFKVIFTVDNDDAGKQLENRLEKFFNEHHKTVYSKQLPAKDVTELVQGMNN